MVQTHTFIIPTLLLGMFVAHSAQFSLAWSDTQADGRTDFKAVILSESVTDFASIALTEAAQASAYSGRVRLHAAPDSEHVTVSFSATNTPLRGQLAFGNRVTAWATGSIALHGGAQLQLEAGAAAHLSEHAQLRLGQRDAVGVRVRTGARVAFEGAAFGGQGVVQFERQSFLQTPRQAIERASPRELNTPSVAVHLADGVQLSAIGAGGPGVVVCNGPVEVGGEHELAVVSVRGVDVNFVCQLVVREFASLDSDSAIHLNGEVDVMHGQVRAAELLLHDGARVAVLPAANARAPMVATRRATLRGSVKIIAGDRLASGTSVVLAEYREKDGEFLAVCSQAVGDDGEAHGPCVHEWAVQYGETHAVATKLALIDQPARSAAARTMAAVGSVLSFWLILFM